MSCVLLCIDVPEASVFGVDLNVWTVGPKFRGLANVPAGPHYLTCSATDCFGNTAVVSGFALHLEPNEVWVGKWDSKSELLMPLTDLEEKQRFILGAKRHDFDSGLGPYPTETFAKWKSLSKHISKACLDRIEPVGKVVPSSRKSGFEEEEEECSAATVGTGTIFFTDMPSRIHDEGASPLEVTRLHMDKSAHLDHILESQLGGDPLLLLGELQYAFVTFVFGQSYDGFEQWKKIVMLLCSCEEAMANHRDLYFEFSDSLQAQIEQAPEDFFSAELSSDNFLNRCLSDLFDFAEESPLATKFAAFRRSVESRFQLKTLGEPQLRADGTFDPADEDAPQIVYL